MDNIMTVRLHEVGKVSAAVKEPEKLAVALGEAVVVEKGNADYYDGAYDVTPLITAQRLPTRSKTMRDDVRINMIPTREIPNAAGGVTFIVGG